MRTRDSRNIGIEIEVESSRVSLPTAVSLCRSIPTGADVPLWEAVSDGSLRGEGQSAWEIRTGGPSGQPSHRVLRGLDNLFPVLAGSTGIWRAAIHVWVDVRDLTKNQLALALANIYVHDDYLFNSYSPQRKESNFSVPLTHLPHVVTGSIKSLLGRGKVLTHMWPKYTSVNASMVYRRGGLEFRHMQTPEIGTDVNSVRDGIDRIRCFATICHRLVSSAKVPGVNQATLMETLLRISGGDYRSLPNTINEEALYQIMRTTAMSSRPSSVETDFLSVVNR